MDSVVLCDLFARSNLAFSIAHCNFRLRGQESERDEAFVRDLAVKYGKTIFVKQFDTARYAAENSVSIQVAARDLRYSWFRSVLGGENATGWIVTAHHADDNIETVVMNFFRGTGLKGLTGMDTFHDSICRPLLRTRKQQILAYATENRLHYVEDSSNASSNYTRNYFRNELLPAVSKVFTNVEENVLKNIDRLEEVNQIFEQAILRFRKNLIEVRGNEQHIPILKLKKTQPLRTIIREIIKDKDFSAAQVDEVIKLMDAENGSYIQSQTFRIIKNRRWLIMSPKSSSETPAHIIIEADDTRVNYHDHLLLVEHLKPAANFSIPSLADIACFDLKEIKFPLLLRKWKQGDYFYPLGMQKKKKVSRFLIDRKLSLTEKEKVWVLEMNKKIIWVMGLRIDDRFKIQVETKNVLKLTITSC